MTAHDQMKAMLDQLMGTGRNGENSKYQVKFTDSKVCKSFLLACCPHEILSSTRMDLGECPKIHDLALRADYEQASKKRDYYYDIDAMEHLQSFIADCDHRTELAKQRLLETQEVLSAEVAAKANKVHELAEQIGKKLAKAEMLGAEGLVDDSMKLMEEIEDLRKKKAAAELEYRNSMPASSYQQQKLRVCEVCSAYLGIHDNDRRLADHFGGKLHLGFIKIREKLAQLQATVEERKSQRRNDGRGDRDRDREREREDRDRVRDRGDRDRGDRDRGDRDRDRDRNRDRDRDRDRYRERDRDRDRDRRDRDRDRGRDRDRERDRDRGDRDRERDRERSKRSPSDSRSEGGRSKRRRTRSRSKSRSHRSRSRSRSRHSHSSRRRSRDRDQESHRSSSRSDKHKRDRSSDRNEKQEEDRPKPIPEETEPVSPRKSEDATNGGLTVKEEASTIAQKNSEANDETSEKEEGELGNKSE